MNISNVLANRTKRLIDQIKPDVVFVQTNECWWKAAKNLEYVKSQDEMDKAGRHLNKLAGVPCSLKGYQGVRFQLFNLFLKYKFNLPIEYNPFLPGLEVKYALEEASKLNSKIVFLGSEFDETTAGRILHDKRTTILKILVNSFKQRTTYKQEAFEDASIILNKGFKSYCESSMDARQVNWFIKYIETIFPEMKRILVDFKEEDMFKQIIQNKGKKMVAVVNQHHIEGLEHHWCNSFGQVPTFNNYTPLETVNPIGDMPLRRMLYDQMYHVIKRDVKTSRMKSTHASLTNDINIYHREFNHQYEHRNI
jgi:hypothetical protein